MTGPGDRCTGAENRFYGIKDDTTMEEVLRAGVFAYVPKPCGYEQLEHLVGLVFSPLFKGAAAS